MYFRMLDVCYVVHQIKLNIIYRSKHPENPLKRRSLEALDQTGAWSERFLARTMTTLLIVLAPWSHQIKV